MNRTFLLAIVSVLIAMVTIQSGSSLAKQLFPLIGPEGTTALRLGFSALILSLIFKPWRIKNNAMQWKNTTIYGLCLGGMNILFYYAIDLIPLGIAVALEFTGPLAVALISSTKKRDLIWVIFAVCGIVLLLPDMNSQTGLDPLGVGLALAAGACWAGYILYGKRTNTYNSGGATVALGITICALVLVPFGMISQGSTLFSWQVLPLGFAIAMLSSAIPYSLEMIALRHLNTKNFSVMMSLEPAIAALAGFIILGELLTLWQWLAVSLVIIASVGSAISTEKSTTSK